MIMTKTTQDSLLLSLLLVLLCLPSYQVRAVEATLPHLVAALPPSQFLHPPGSPLYVPAHHGVKTGTRASPSRPCGSNIGSHVTALEETRCRNVSRVSNRGRGAPTKDIKRHSP